MVIIIFAGTEIQSAKIGEIIPTIPVMKMSSIEIGISGTTKMFAIGDMMESRPKITDI